MYCFRKAIVPWAILWNTPKAILTIWTGYGDNKKYNPKQLLVVEDFKFSLLVEDKRDKDFPKFGMVWPPGTVIQDRAQ